jgi:hypothetical protein
MSSLLACVVYKMEEFLQQLAAWLLHAHDTALGKPGAQCMA